MRRRQPRCGVRGVGFGDLTRSTSGNLSSRAVIHWKFIAQLHKHLNFPEGNLRNLKREHGKAGLDVAWSSLV